MVCAASQLNEITVLASETDWAWPRALGDIFRPRGVNLIVARRPNEFVDVLSQTYVHAMIVDADDDLSGLTMVRIVRMDFPRMPCLLLAQESKEDMLGEALHLNVFCVIDKPVDMGVLQQQLHRLFVKTYNSHVFS